jgi:outer membrane lipoprotein SlyB
MSSDHNKYQRDLEHENKLIELQKKIESEKINSKMQFGLLGHGKPPKKEPGDGYVFAGALLGLFGGAALGGYLATFTALVSVGAGIIIGLFSGALIGTLIGSLIKKLVLQNRQ